MLPLVSATLLFWLGWFGTCNMTLDLIIVGKPICSLEELGFSEDEDTIVYEDERFLPRILVKQGLFKSTSTVKQINKQRLEQDQVTIPCIPYKIPSTDPDQNLWRTVERKELTPFKIGRRVFWLLVGELND